MSNVGGATTFLRTLASAEAATVNESWGEAASLWAGVVEANPVEGRFWTQLARAREHLHDDRGAIEAFAHAFELRDGFPTDAAYAMARCHARLGEEERAMSWLERAWGSGSATLPVHATKTTSRGSIPTRDFGSSSALPMWKPCRVWMDGGST